MHPVRTLSPAHASDVRSIDTCGVDDAPIPIEHDTSRVGVIVAGDATEE
jgi:hypothetical protein